MNLDFIKRTAIEFSILIGHGAIAADGFYQFSSKYDEINEIKSKHVFKNIKYQIIRNFENRILRMNKHHRNCNYWSAIEIIL